MEGLENKETPVPSMLWSIDFQQTSCPLFNGEPTAECLNNRFAACPSYICAGPPASQEFCNGHLQRTRLGMITREQTLASGCQKNVRVGLCKALIFGGVILGRRQENYNLNYLHVCMFSSGLVWEHLLSHRAKAQVLSIDPLNLLVPLVDFWQQHELDNFSAELHLIQITNRGRSNRLLALTRKNVSIPSGTPPQDYPAGKTHGLAN